MRRWSPRVLLVTVALLVGCAGGGAPAAPGGGSAAPAGLPAGERASPGVSAERPPSVEVSPPVRIRASYSVVSGGIGAYWVAAEAGLWRGHGLDVEFSLISGTPASMAALIAGETQFAVGSGDAVLRVQAQNPDVVSLVTTTVGSTHRLMVVPAIQRLEDLRGKRIGVAAIGDGAYSIMSKALVRLGFNPNADVTWIGTGGGSTAAMISGLAAGAFDATPLTPPNDIIAARQGAHALIDTADLDLPSGGLAVNTMRSTLEQRRQVVKAFVAGVVDAVRLYKEDADFGKEVLARYTGMTDPEAIDWAYQVYSGRLRPVRLYLDHAEMRELVEELLPENPQLAQVQLERVLDNSILEELEREGYFTRPL